MKLREFRSAKLQFGNSKIRLLLPREPKQCNLPKKTSKWLNLESAKHMLLPSRTTWNSKSTFRRIGTRFNLVS